MATSARIDIRSLSLAELQTQLIALGEPGFRAKQVYQWLWEKSCTDFEEMSNLSKSLRETLKDRFEITKPGGAFYLYPRAPGGQLGTEFVNKAIANNLLIIPGQVFSAADTHFRISYAVADRELERGAELLRQLARS